MIMCICHLNQWCIIQNRLDSSLNFQKENNVIILKNLFQKNGFQFIQINIILFNPPRWIQEL
ncbi:hypothetical protein pb186bvf_018444 [Paramecium bursaria]